MLLISAKIFSVSSVVSSLRVEFYRLSFLPTADADRHKRACIRHRKT